MIDAQALTEAQRRLAATATTAWLAPSPAGAGQPFVSRSDGQLDLHPGWPEDIPSPSREDVRRLIHLGVFESLDQPGQGIWVFGLTDEGIKLGRWLGATVPPVAVPFPVRLEWLNMIPVLEATVRLSEEPALPGLEEFAELVPIANLAAALGHENRDPNLLRAVRHLADDGYLEFDERRPPEASRVRVLPRTLQLLRDWPSTEPEMVARRLDDALAAAIEQTEDPEQKSKLQRFRDDAKDIGKSVLAGAVLAAGKVAAGT